MTLKGSFMPLTEPTEGTELLFSIFSVTSVGSSKAGEKSLNTLCYMSSKARTFN